MSQSTSPKANLVCPLELLLLGLGIALATGYVEAAVIQFQRLALGQLAYEGPDAIWMAPISYAVFALLPTAVLMLIALVRPALVTLQRAVFVLGLLAVMAISWLVFGARMHPVAHLLLGAGIAAQLARLARVRPPRFAVLLRRATAVLALATAVLAIGMPGSRAIKEKIQVARLAKSGQSSPNVLLIIWDTARRKNLSLYGYERATTPKLTEWAERGVVFERALSTSSWTLPSHASMFTGRLTQELSTGWRTPLDDRYPTLAEQLRDRGYYTAGFVANVMAASRESGLNRGFIRYEDFQISVRELLRSSAAGKLLWRYIPFHNDRGSRHLAKNAPVITADFLNWLPRTQGRPFFAFLNYYDAHDPYYAPADIRKQFRTGRGDLDRYDAALHVLDDDLDRLLKELDRRGVLENTIVILSSDHGELFGEKGLTRHGNSLYFPLLDVPLVVWPLGAAAGTRVQAAVSLRDLPNTVLEAVTGQAGSTFPGRSLRRHWALSKASTNSAPDTVISGIGKGVRTPPEEPVTKGNMTSLFAGDFHYILNGDGSEELYNVNRDPAQEMNLAASPAAAPHVERFRAALRRYVPAEWTPVAPGQHATAVTVKAQAGKLD